MKKCMLLPALPLLGGLAGFFLRLWQNRMAWSPDTHLYQTGHPASVSLLILMAGTLLFALFLTWSVPLPALSPQRLTSPISMGLALGSSLCFFFTLLLGLSKLQYEMQVWKLRSPHVPFPLPLILLLLSSAVGVFAAIAVGRGYLRREKPRSLALWVTVPAYGALFWLIYIYQMYSSIPILFQILIPILTCITLQLSLYYQAALYYHSVHPKLLLFFSLVGIVFGMTSLADTQPLFLRIFTLAILLSTLAGLVALAQSRTSPLSEAPQSHPPSGETNP